MTAVPILGERCHSCSRFFPSSQLLRFGDSITRCFQCQEKHLAALDALAGNPPAACGECGVTFEDLAARTAGEEVSMFVHMKDGVYQVLCRRCDRIYVAKRKDLYGATAFGYHERKL